jgi:Trypsin-like peptidase domain
MEGVERARMTRAIGRLVSRPSNEPAGTTLGAAFFVSPHVGLTAFHCIGNRVTGKVVTREFDVVFDDGQAVAARFVAGDGEADFALIEVTEPFPRALRPIRLMRDARVGEPYRCVGYPNVDGPASFAVGGVVRDAEARLFEQRVPALQLQAAEAAAGLSLHGLSGAPILVGSPEAAVGIVRWNPERSDESDLAVGGTFFASPMRHLVERRPELEEFVRPRREQLLLKDSLTPLLRRHTLFGGRDVELARLDRFLAGPGRTYLLVTALSGYGKTALLANWVKRLEDAGEPVAYHFISRIDHVDGEDITLLSLCEQLAALAGDNEPLPEHPAKLRALCPVLVENAVAETGSLVVVLDGLDEADWALEPGLFRRDGEPPGLHVVLSARTIAEIDWLQELVLSPEEVATFELGTLGRSQIESLLRDADATPWAGDTEAVRIMHERSDGDPFYVHYLVEDISTGLITSRDDLSQQPHGLDAYLDRWWAQMSDQVGEGPVRDLLGYLLVAHGPLSRDDLTEASEHDALDGFVFERAKKKLFRYMIGDESGFALCHPRFQNYLARKRIKESDQRPYRERLLAYCARWPDHGAPYALRFLSVHLSEARRRDALLELARDDRFAGVQRATLPDEPRLPLQTVELALRSAAEIDNAGAMAEGCLLYAYRLVETMLSGSPWKAVKGGNLARALATIQLLDIEFGVLWSLLIVWELNDTGRHGEAVSVLESLQSKDLPFLGGWKLDDFRPLFVATCDTDEVLGTSIIGRLLDDDQRLAVCQTLAKEGRARAALGLAHSIEDESTRARSFVSIAQAGYFEGLREAVDEIREPGLRALAVAQVTALSGESAQADEMLADVSSTIESLDPSEQGDAWWELVDLTARVGHAHEAARLAMYFTDRKTRIRALCQIGTIQHEAERQPDAELFLTVALDHARGGDDADAVVRARALTAVAEAAIATGDADWGRRILDEAWTAALETAGHDEHTQLLLEVAEAVIRLGNLDDAVNLLPALEGSWAAQSASLALASARWRSGEEPAAREMFVSILSATAERSGDEEPVRTGLADIPTALDESPIKDVAIEYAKLGEIPAALALASSIESDDKAWVLGAIATAQADRGDVVDSREAFSLTIEAAQQAQIEQGRLQGHSRMLGTLGSIGSILAAAGDFVSALHIVNAIEDTEVRIKALVAIGTAQSEHGLAEDAKRTFQWARELGRAITSAWVPEPDRSGKVWRVAGRSRVHGMSIWRSRGWNLEQIATAQARAGWSDDALATSGEIEDPNELARALASIAATVIAHGDRDAGRRIFGRAIAGAAELRSGAKTLLGDDARSVALAEIAKHQAEAGEIADALDTARTIGDAEHHASAVREIAIRQAQMGDRAAARPRFVEAFELASSVNDDELRPQALMEVVSGVLDSGDLDQAVELVAQIEDDWGARAEVARALARGGDVERATEVASEIDDLDEWVDAMGEIAEEQAREGQPTAVMETLGSIRESLAEIEDDEGREDAFASLVAIEARTGNFEQSLTTAAGISDESFRAEALRDIALAHARSGQTSEAVGVAAQILADRNEHLGRIAEAIADAGDRDQFKELLIPSSAYIDVAYQACELLARVYPDQASAIAEAVTLSVRDSSHE